MDRSQAKNSDKYREFGVFERNSLEFSPKIMKFPHRGRDLTANSVENCVGTAPILGQIPVGDGMQEIIREEQRFHSPKASPKREL